ncbi:VanZ family protein [Hymenobacter baengnokdamensis]|uniref:VanZ family protein n=1 Tax=Hymenobacter baengnokdamensis TaxID=2615203 RepID=UPI001786E9FF|nr:VanZ family protein [Hymenobacter baengnokdamensis]
MKTLTRRFYGRLALAWVAVMLVLTLTPAQDMPRTPEWKLLSFDTAAHAGVFAVLAGLGWLWARCVPRLARYAGGWVLLGCVLFGGLIELLQYIMNMGRHAEWTDLLGDTIGAALVLAGAGLAGRGRRRSALPLAFLLVLPDYAHAQAAEPDLARARRTIEELASPKMHGRGYVQQGEHLAAAYLRNRLRQLGLQPLAPDYTQPFTLDVNTFPGKVDLTLAPNYGALPSPSTRLIAGTDFIAAPASGPAHLQAEVIPFDTLVFQDSTRARRYLLPQPGPVSKPCPSCPLLLRARDYERLASLPAATKARISQRPQVMLVPKLTASLADDQEPAARLEVLAAKWPAPASTPYAKIDLDAQLLHNYQTQNLASIVRGSAQPDSFLVVSAHYDHLGMMGRNVYFPGANDNASGVALLLELAAYYARPENRPACSVVFLLFGAEEAGLVGSTYFVQHPLIPLARIKFLLNLDLLGTGEEGATVVNGRVHEAAFRRLTFFNEAHHYLPRLTARGPAANSDHFPFSQAGVPAFFLYTRGGSLAYHNVNDQPAALSLAGFAGAFGLARDFLNELASN